MPDAPPVNPDEHVETDTAPWSAERRAAFVLAVVVLLLAIVIGVLIVQLPSHALAGWVVVLLFFSISGAFGGVLALASRDNDGEPVKLLDPKTLVVAILGGVGGAIAALSFAVADKQVDPDSADPTRSRLSWICAGAIGGFIGFRLLKKVSDEVAKRLAQDAKNLAGHAENQAGQANKKAGDAEALAEAATKQATALKGQLAEAERKSRLRLELDGYVRDVKERILESGRVPTKAKVQEAIDRLEKYRLEFPDHRSAGIVLARLHVEGLRDSDARTRAIDILTKLEKLLRAHDPMTATDIQDAADVCFNRACYRAQLEDWPGADRDFSTSFHEMPANTELARMDSDFGVAAQKHPSLVALALQVLDEAITAPEIGADKRSGYMFTKAGFRARQWKAAAAEQKSGLLAEIAGLLSQVKLLAPEEMERVAEDPDLKDVAGDPAIQPLLPPRATPTPPATQAAVAQVENPPAPAVSQTTGRRKPKKRK